MEKLLKMVIIPDLIEAEAGDIPAFEAMNDKKLREKKKKKNMKLYSK